MTTNFDKIWKYNSNSEMEVYKNMFHFYFNEGRKLQNKIDVEIVREMRDKSASNSDDWILECAREKLSKQEIN